MSISGNTIFPDIVFIVSVQQIPVINLLAVLPTVVRDPNPPFLALVKVACNHLQGKPRDLPAAAWLSCVEFAGRCVWLRMHQERSRGRESQSYFECSIYVESAAAVDWVSGLVRRTVGSIVHCTCT